MNVSQEDKAFLQAFAQTRAFVLGRPTRAAVSPDGDAVLFLRSPARSSVHALYELNVQTGNVRRLCGADDLQSNVAGELSPEERARRERQRMTDTGITSFVLAPQGPLVLLPLAGALYLLNRQTGRTRALLPPTHAPTMDARFTPDGGAVTFVSQHDLWWLPVPTSFDEPCAAPHRLTPGGSDEVFYGAPEFVAQEEMGRFEGYWFAPDGTVALVAVVDERGVESFSIADPLRPEAKPAQFRYPRPGKANADVGLVLVRPSGDEPLLNVVWDKQAFPYLARVLFQAATQPPAIWVQSRDQRRAALLLVDLATGETTFVFQEHDPDWVNLDPALPRWLPDGSGLLHVTEAQGSPALCLRNPEGENQILVPTGAGFLSMVSVETKARTAVVLLGDALTSRLAWISLSPQSHFSPQWLGDDATAPTDITTVATGGPAEAQIIVETRVSLSGFPTTRVLDRNGCPLHVLADEAETPAFAIDAQLLTVGDRKWNAAVIRPAGFDVRASYPVIVHVYGGPHALTVKSDQRHYVFDQWLANQGAIVVAIDNRGTPRRGREWERAIKGRFGSVPLEDQVQALQALAAEVPQMDLQRVGIYGWSFGGFMSALAVLRRPDVFKVAVSGAPVVDWHDYDTHYTERYLDLPEAAPHAYREGNLLTYAPTLSRPLLLIHGTADDNVYLFHSLKLADALHRHGCHFDFLPLPGTTHQIGDAQVRERVWARVAHYLFSHLT